MKTRKLNEVLCVILLLTNSFVPVCSLIATTINFKFELKRYIAFAAVSEIISVVCAFLLTKKADVSKTVCVTAGINLPVSVINWGIFLFKSSDVITTVLIIINFICSLIIFIKVTRKSSLKTAITAVASFFAVILIVFTPFYFLIANFGKTTVYRTVESPDSTYRAEIVDSDNGALGGNTVVKVFNDKKNYDFFIFRFYENPEIVYIGDWGKFDSLNVYWSDVNTLTVEDETYYFE